MAGTAAYQSLETEKQDDIDDAPITVTSPRLLETICNTTLPGKRGSCVIHAACNSEAIYVKGVPSAGR